MDLKHLGQGELWMTAEERKLAKRLVDRIRVLFKARGVADTPLVALRVDDLCVSFLLTKRAEQELAFPAEAEDAKKGAAAAAVEAVGRARERLRKSMKELEEACAKMGAPVDIGVADLVKPLMKRGQEVLEEGVRAQVASPQDQG